MAEFNITGPNGRKFKITGDAPPTEEELEQIFSQIPAPSQDGPVSAPMAEDSAFAKAQRLQNTTVPELIMGSAPGRALQGLADAPMGFAQTATAPPRFADDSRGPDLGIDPSQAITPIRDATTAVHEGITDTLRQGDEMRESGREAFRSEGADVARIGGNIAMGVGATKNIPVGKTLMERVRQGMIVSGVIGGTAPVTGENFAEENQANALSATLLGGAIPVGTKAIAGAAKGGMNFLRGVSNLLPGGRGRVAARDVANLVRQTANNSTKEVDNLITELKAVPVGQPADEAIANTGLTKLAGLARMVENRASDAWAKLTKEQGAARVAAIHEASGGRAGVPLQETITSLTAARKKITDPLFAIASRAKGKIDPKRAITVIDRIINKDPNATESGLIGSLRQIRGQLIRTAPTPTGRIPIRGFPSQPDILTTSPRELISASRNIAAMIGKKDPVTGKPVNDKIVRELVAVKKVLDAQIAKVVPSFAKANSTFSEMSRPIDKASIGLALEGKLVATLAETEGSAIKQVAARFVSALDDDKALVSKVTGFKRSKGLQSYFDDAEISKLQGLADDLMNSAEFDRLAQLGRPAAARIAKELEGHTTIPVLKTAVVILNGIIKRGGAIRENAALDEAAKVFLNPKLFAEMLRAASPSEVSAFREALGTIGQNLTRTAPAIAATRE